MPLATLPLMFGIALGGLTADSWAVRAASHELLVEAGPLGIAVAAAGVKHPDGEVAMRCRQAAEGRRPKVAPCPIPKWEPYPLWK